MSNRFTVVFAGRVQDIPSNPYKVESLFGQPMAIDHFDVLAENERLRSALRYALENGIATQYHGDDDDCGTHSCCGEVSYKPHEAECWTMKASAALEGK